jgi:protein gp37
MGKTTAISWTDHTFNPWWGCTKVSAGCDNCYAEAFDRRLGGDHWGKGEQRRVFADKHWREPLHWDQDAERDGVKRKVFCASMADVMDDEAPEGARERLWNLINNTPHLIWQLLTKRPHRYSRYLPARFTFQNVWLGVTAESQECYDVRGPIMREVACMKGLLWWVSYEPAIGPLSLLTEAMRTASSYAIPDWIICGGESGMRRRAFLQEWAEDLRKQCKLLSIPFFMKQMGGVTAEKGKLAIPAHLQIHEFPEITA